MKKLKLMLIVGVLMMGLMSCSNGSSVVGSIESDTIPSVENDTIPSLKSDLFPCMDIRNNNQLLSLYLDSMVNYTFVRVERDSNDDITTFNTFDSVYVENGDTLFVSDSLVSNFKVVNYYDRDMNINDTISVNIYK